MAYLAAMATRLAFIVEVPLGRDVVKVERIDIGLIRQSGAVADHHHKPSSAQRLSNLLIVRGRRVYRGNTKHCEHAERDSERRSGSS